ncbi:beta-N-acetylglucosaminidase [Zobellia amurskyensis]|uniref:beta-N-acetylhexosaminidase n=1 Tax=Zobellia amurskyensis TaxID=248905 RepID=A0A7X2ZQK2_9FLAO|nr:beta-N-acetylhexosaminidase [Zobellia amurskyensis]MUH34572.1 beta-N-acetylglucosaminidase [Zobellia amurskyensis]
MKRILFLSIILLSFSCAENYDRYKDVTASEKAYGIIPKPSNLTKNLGVFALDENVVINSSASLENEADYLVGILGVVEELSADDILNNSEGQHLIELKISDEVSEEEGYVLEVGYDKITIKGKTSTGIFYGIETLRQLITKQTVDGEEMFVVPATKIEDAPRFAYRGMMLDTGRYFYDVAFVKQFIDLIALHKMNIFHWHLTEDQGWRIEIKKYPKLTEVGAWRNGTEIGQTPGTESDNKKHGGFYTQEQIKEVIEYAKKKHITIIPEIDMPGHNGAAIASYPFLSCFPEEKTPMNENIISEATKELMANGTKKVVQESWGIKTDVLCAGKESTYTFYENVLSEVIDLFPSEYIHIGGDECRKDNWKRCPNCQKKIADDDLEGENGLQSHFINHMEKFVNSKGKRIIGWDEILEGGLAPNATVMSWRGLTGGIEAAKQGHPVIISPREPCYFDYYQDKNFASEPLAIGGRGPNTVKDVYMFDPLPKELSSNEQKHIWGVQANLWTEYISTPDYAEYMLLPRMTAISEVAWSSPNASEDYQEFLQRLDRFKGIYDKMELNYAKHVFE